MSSHYTACGVRPMPAGSSLVVRFTNYCELWGVQAGACYSILMIIN